MNYKPKTILQLKLLRENKNWIVDQIGMGVKQVIILEELKKIKGIITNQRTFRIWLKIEKISMTPQKKLFTLFYDKYKDLIFFLLNDDYSPAKILKYLIVKYPESETFGLTASNLSQWLVTTSHTRTNSLNKYSDVINANLDMSCDKIADKIMEVYLADVSASSVSMWLRDNNITKEKSIKNRHIKVPKLKMQNPYLNITGICRPLGSLSKSERGTIIVKQYGNKSK